MKISNETKIGSLTAIAITTLILGFNYLKGKNLTERNDVIYAVFPSVEGLVVSSPVYINGFQVGKVSDMQASDKDLSGIIVKISLKKEINIPDNSVAILNSEILQSTSVVIRKGSSTSYVQSGDTIQTKPSTGIMGEVRNSLNPAISSLNQALISLNNLIAKISVMMDPRTQNNLQEMVANLKASSESLKAMMDQQNGALARSLSNVASITGNLKDNNNKVDTIVDNIQALSGKLKNLQMDETLVSVNKTLASLNAVLNKANSREGSLGLLLNDPKLYQELRQTNRSLNILLDDFRTHPKRYVNVSVFGKKDKSGPLDKPIYDSIPK